LDYHAERGYLTPHGSNARFVSQALRIETLDDLASHRHLCLLLLNRERVALLFNFPIRLRQAAPGLSYLVLNTEQRGAQRSIVEKDFIVSRFERIKFTQELGVFISQHLIGSFSLDRKAPSAVQLSLGEAQLL